MNFVLLRKKNVFYFFANYIEYTTKYLFKKHKNIVNRDLRKSMNFMLTNGKHPAGCRKRRCLVRRIHALPNKFQATE